MASATDMMGLGLSPQLSLRMWGSGTGPVSLATAGSAFASATGIKIHQYMVNVSTNTSGGNTGLALPSGAGIGFGDGYVVCNNSVDSFKLYASTGVTIVAGGTAGTSSIVVPPFTSMICMPFSTTQWNACKGS